MNSAGMFSNRVVSGDSVCNGASVDSESTLARITVGKKSNKIIKILFFKGYLECRNILDFQPHDKVAMLVVNTHIYFSSQNLQQNKV